MSEKETAVPKKPATRRKKATGPTKPAALKKLGLTQEDLDLLEQIKELRESAVGKEVPSEAPAVEVVEEPKLDSVDPEELNQTAELAAKTKTQQDAKIKAYHALNEAGLDIPDDLRAEVETAIIAKSGKVEEPQSGPWFVRNLRNVEVRFRLSRQVGQGKKPVELKARGQRGDLVKLEADDLNDDALLNQVHYNVVEIIPVQQARDIISKQAINQQEAVHPALSMLRNELGEQYAEDAFKPAEEHIDNSITVARLTPQGGEAGAIPTTGPRGAIDWNAVRQSGTPQVQETVGNPAIFSNGFARNDSEVARDAIARTKGIEGPAAGGITTVVVDQPHTVVKK